ncbi:hypothetical protein T4A_1855 [Trichinella pseudospiralis]|uniref:Uncharacterized protein n=1 Tax=Trichinella pseudospiralis TaxID=6337 RepID=A0A0V1E5A5_TRIPS|nr:hypothetical protein T4A_1855 [Trichinella pseudospiralis]
MYRPNGTTITKTGFAMVEVRGARSVQSRRKPNRISFTQTPESSLIKAEQEFVSRTPLNSTLASLLTKLQQWALPTNEKPQKWETLEVMNYQRNIVK